MTYPDEKNNYPKAMAISTVIMAIFIALSYIISISNFQPPEELGMGGIVVNYGTSVTGMGTDYTSTEEPSSDPNANNKLPDKVVPEKQTVEQPSNQVSNKDIVTQSTEDAVNINTKKSTSNTPPAATSEDKPAKPTINQNALYKGKANKGTGQGDGTGDTPGNQGSVNGDPLAPYYGEGGSGNGLTPLPVAKFKSLVKPEDNGQETGVVMVKIQVNKQGRVISATAGAKGSTFSNNAIYRKCEASLLNASLTPIEKGPEIRVFFVPIRFGVQ